MENKTFVEATKYLIDQCLLEITKKLAIYIREKSKKDLVYKIVDQVLEEETHGNIKKLT